MIKTWIAEAGKETSFPPDSPQKARQRQPLIEKEKNMFDVMKMKEKAFSLYISNLLKDPGGNSAEIMSLARWLVHEWSKIHSPHKNYAKVEFKEDWLLEKLGLLLKGTAHEKNWKFMDYVRPKTDDFYKDLSAFEESLNQIED